MSEGNYALKGVEIFAAGEWRGKKYTRQDLQDIARNFELFSSPRAKKRLLRVPAVLGHSEEQVLLKDSGLPAAGWPSRVWAEGDLLKADFVDEPLPASVARLLEGKAYRTTSAEVYDSAPQGVPARGKCLRRIAFLGFDPPQVKHLNDIPVPELMSERFASPPPYTLKFRDVRPLPGGAYAVFSEVVPMTPEQMLQALQTHGVDPAMLQGCPQPALAELLRVCEAKGPQQQAPGAAPPGQEQNSDPYDPDAPVPEPKDDAERQKFSDQAKRMLACANKWAEAFPPAAAADEDEDEDSDGVPDADDADDDADGIPDEADADDDRPDKKKAFQKMSEIDVAAMVEKAVGKAVEKAVQSAIATVTKHSEDVKESHGKLRVDPFIESRLQAGKIAPYELDAADPANLRDELYRADSKTCVRKFSEHGKEMELTELDLKMRAIDRRRPQQFGEKFKAPGAPDAESAEVEKIEQHFEMHSERFNAVGTTRDELVSAFKSRRKNNATLTAERFLGGKA